MSKRHDRIEQDGTAGHQMGQNPYALTRMTLMVFWVCQRIGAQWRKEQEQLRANQPQDELTKKAQA